MSWEVASVIVWSLALAPLWYCFERMIGYLSARRCARHLRRMGPTDSRRLGRWVCRASSHTLQMCLWWLFFFSGEDWVLDVGSWARHFTPRPADVHGCRRITPLYAVYFGYCMYILYAEREKERIGNTNFNDHFTPYNARHEHRGNPDLWTPGQLARKRAAANIHHVLVVALLAGSVWVGAWRIGAVVRLLHDPADVFFSLHRIYTYFYTYGQTSYDNVKNLYVLNRVFWFFSRVCVHGYLNVCVSTMWLSMESLPGPGMDATCLALLVGSWVMWALQVYWTDRRVLDLAALLV